MNIIFSDKVQVKHQENHLDSYIVAPHFSTKLLRSQLNYVKKHYSEKLLDEVCQELNVPQEYLQSDDNWISTDFNRKFAELIRIRTGDDEIFRKIGYHMLAPENINHVEYFLLKMVGPFTVFKHMDFYLAKLNRVCTSHVTRESLGKYRIRINAIDSQEIVPDFYPNMLGTLEGFGPFFDLRNMKVSYHKIIENTCAEYIIEFAAWRVYLKMMMRFMIIVGMGVLFTQLIAKHSGNYFLPLMTILNIVLLTGVYFAFNFGSIFKVINEHNKDLYELSLKKNERLRKTSDIADRKNKEANLLGAISKSINLSGETHEAIKKCIDEVKSKFHYETISIFLTEGQSNKLRQFYSVGSGNVLQLNKNISLEPVFSDTLIVCPIGSSNRQYGAFIVGSEKGPQALTNQDKVFFENIANMLGLLLESENNVLTSRQIAHDIRSPLSVLNMLLPSINVIENEEKIELARMAVERVNNIADDILKKRSSLVLKNNVTILISELVRNIISEKQVEYSDRNIEFVFENKNHGAKTASVDLADLARILSNLINNSVDAIANNGIIKITLDDLGGKIKLIISDNGRGIPADVLDRIGTKGFSYNKLQGNGGSGLGIYNAKKIINSVNGTLHINSEVGVGTKVIIVI